jgi:hypothetical protein
MMADTITMPDEIVEFEPESIASFIERKPTREKLRVLRVPSGRLDIELWTRTTQQGRRTYCGLTRDQARIIAERLMRFAATGK